MLHRTYKFFAKKHLTSYLLLTYLIILTNRCFYRWWRSGRTFSPWRTGFWWCKCSFAFWLQGKSQSKHYNLGQKSYSWKNCSNQLWTKLLNYLACILHHQIGGKLLLLNENLKYSLWKHLKHRTILTWVKWNSISRCTGSKKLKITLLTNSLCMKQTKEWLTMQRSRNDHLGQQSLCNNYLWMFGRGRGWRRWWVCRRSRIFSYFLFI